MEFIWRASPSFKEDADMLTHVLHTHYSAPMVSTVNIQKGWPLQQGFDWEEYGQSVRITPQGVESRASHLIGVLKVTSHSTHALYFNNWRCVLSMKSTANAYIWQWYQCLCQYSFLSWSPLSGNLFIHCIECCFRIELDPIQQIICW